MKPTTRPFNTEVFLLRALQVGLRLEDLLNLEFGMVADLFVEKANDSAEYPEKATQEDINSFFH